MTQVVMCFELKSYWKILLCLLILAYLADMISSYDAPTGEVIQCHNG